MQTRSGKCAKTAFAAVLTIMLLLFGAFSEVSVYAAKSNEKIPALSQSQSRLAFKVEYTDDEVKTAIDGVTLTVYKVADLKVVNGVAKYSVPSEFKEGGFRFSDMTAEDSVLYAERAADIVKARGLTGKSATTNNKGDVDFGMVDNGIYLIMQTGSTGTAKQFSQLTPWLAEVPELVGETSDSYSWNYEVVAYPKPLIGGGGEEVPPSNTPPEEEFDGGTEEKTKKHKTDEGETKEKTPFYRQLVKTGDENSVMVFAGAALMAAGLLAMILVKRRRNHE